MFELLFKYPAPVFRNGQLVLLSGWPLWVLALAIVVAAAVWSGQLLRSRGEKLGLGRGLVVWALQSALAALVLLMLWRPAVQIATSRPQQNVVAVLVDTSRSMALDDSGGGPRLAATRRVLEESLLPALRSRFAVRLYGFADRATPVESPAALAADGGVTRLGDAVAEVLRESRVLPLAAMVVLSDGADNSTDFAARLNEIGGHGIPVHTVGVGRPSLRDVEVEEVIAPARVPAGSRVRVVVRLRQEGFDGRRLAVAVRLGDREAARREIVLGRGEERRTEEMYVAAGAAGAHVLSASVEPIDGEEVTANNRRLRPLQVVSRRARVLYVEGEPRWEMKFIRRALEDDPTLELISLLRTSGNKVYRQGIEDPSMLAAGFPDRADVLFAFDALVIGSVEAAYFTAAQQALLEEFVRRRGGGVLWLGGRRSLGDGGWAASPLADVLPVQLSARSPAFVRARARAELTAEGRESPLTLLDEDRAANAKRWAALPELADFQRTGEPKPGAVVLLSAVPAGAAPAPLLAMQSYGRGHAYLFATGGSWRWRMRSPHEDPSHRTFWRQLLRGLVARTAGPVSAAADRSLYADDDRVLVRAEVRSPAYEPVSDARAWATITDAEGARETIELAPSAATRGLYEGRLSARREGAHTIDVYARRDETDLGRDAVAIHRQDGIAEGFHPQQDVDRLRTIARHAGGRYWTLDATFGLGQEITYSGAGITVRETLDLWDMPVLFLLALGLRTAEWLVRRRGGRV